MSTLGNIFWFLAGGLVTGLSWWLAGVVMFCTIIGIPWTRSCFVIGDLAFFPFGREAISRRELTGKDDLGTGCLGLIGNILWFFLAGFWLAVHHAFWALVCAITIIGIPFAVQHMKLAMLALSPVGKTIVRKETAATVR